MTPEERVTAVAQFGFSERQARFLVTVMRHAGICVPRQYATFAGVANGGQKTNAFFETLIARGYASACPCLHNRARLYHVHHRPLYRALGEPESRYRRPVAARDVRDRLRILDGLLATPEVVWLANADEKARHLATLCPAVTAGILPHVTVDNGASWRQRFFPDHLPIGIDPQGHLVLLFLVTAVVNDEFSGFLQRHADLLRVVPGWTLRLLFFKAVEASGAAFRQAVPSATSWRARCRPQRSPSSRGTSGRCERRRCAGLGSPPTHGCGTSTRPSTPLATAYCTVAG